MSDHSDSDIMRQCRELQKLVKYVGDRIDELTVENAALRSENASLRSTIRRYELALNYYARESSQRDSETAIRVLGGVEP